jgi:anti-anti-sigma regulatory factor
MDITLQGRCTVERAAELRDTLLRALEATPEGGEARVSLAGVEEADLTLFQLLHAARNTFALSGRGLHLLPDLPPELSERARHCGLEQLAAGREERA